MKVYSIIGDGRYGGGMAIVAARSPKEALKKAGAEIRDSIWNTNYLEGQCTLLRGLSFDGSVPTVLAHHETGE